MCCSLRNNLKNLLGYSGNISDMLITKLHYILKNYTLGWDEKTVILSNNLSFSNPLFSILQICNLVPFTFP